MTRQEQRTLLLLLGIVVGGVAIHQWRGSDAGPALVIDAETGETVSDPQAPPTFGEEALTPPNASGAALVDINTASATELMTLPGIGESRAREIIAHREAHGPFRSVEALDEVSGIGEGILARVRSFATVSGAPPPAPPESPPTVGSAPAPLAVAASPVPESTPTPAGPVNVNTATREELMSLPGIGEVLAQRILDHRAAHGAFHRPEDLLAIPRIGERTVDRLRPLITF